MAALHLERQQRLHLALVNFVRWGLLGILELGARFHRNATGWVPWQTAAFAARGAEKVFGGQIEPMVSVSSCVDPVELWSSGLLKL